MSNSTERNFVQTTNNDADVDATTPVADLTGRLEFSADRHLVKLGPLADIHLASMDGHQVAVKVMRDIGISETKRRALVQKMRTEMEIWSSLHHPNILPFEGYYFYSMGSSTDSLFSLVSPWMSNGTAVQYIHQHPEIDRLHIMYGVAEGLMYLHQHNIIHADLKESNIFINDQGCPVLADFGLSRLAKIDEILTFTTTSSTSTNANPGGTVRFMAPELSVLKDMALNIAEQQMSGLLDVSCWK
ncbi:kinase-like protein [Sistotremastrum niveocremeum HHB9708]|uniref:Kinase-like protein n=1 Tax=Sistotremastrum niveocremeum HHB9708 TaxID=1314777 RepID=A0A164NQD6_9AGAM|nr:kinase-like protein [Sistotremastrum niveocremeum HHB9708]